MKKIDTLRVSVTDRCNLRCIYCYPGSGVPRIPHDEVLTFEEIERVVRIAVQAGVTKVRITGGEPLVRQGIANLIGQLSRIPGLLDLPMTTNGVLLADKANELKAAGLSRVTVSLDTLRQDRYERITGQPWLMRVREGILSAIKAKLLPVKINVVVVPGENDDEVVEFAEWAREEDLEVRFIERMPLLPPGLSPHCGRQSDDFLPSQIIRQRIEARLGKMDLLPGQKESSPARVYELCGGRGRIGFIAPRSEPFCKFCARMRLTPEGKLRVCLARDLELDVKTPLRKGITDTELAELYATALAMKPQQEVACFAPIQRPMSQIGG